MGAAPTPVAQFIDRFARHRADSRGPTSRISPAVSAATVSRCGDRPQGPHPKAQLLVSDLAYVVTRLGEYYGPDEIRAWLYARHPQLDGERAIDLIHDDRTEDVLAILDRLDADAYL